ncbi:MAG: DUF1634 domain-containing protein [Actinomycetota bacterium]|nr:DUF1634 domain-containing protein [Actinomycetota bacterium]
MSDPVVPDEQLGRPADPRTNTLVQWVLRTGLVMALALLIVGLIVQMSTSNGQAVQVRMFHLLSTAPAGTKIMGVGMLVLTLTPAVGVLSVVGSWIRERDTRFVGVGAAVVAVLAAAVLVGLAG